ncbi:hypothetical protein ACWEN3_23675 [Streptomyces sp. NPDC004561]
MFSVTLHTWPKTPHRRTQQECGHHRRDDFERRKGTSEAHDAGRRLIRTTEHLA